MKFEKFIVPAEEESKKNTNNTESELNADDVNTLSRVLQHVNVDSVDSQKARNNPDAEENLHPVRDHKKPHQTPPIWERSGWQEPTNPPETL